MPRIKDSLDADLSGYTPIEASDRTVLPSAQALQPSFNPMIRCPLPATAATPDSLRQFYLGGQVPQMRVLPPQTTTTAGTSTSTTTAVVRTTSSSTVSASITAQQVGVTTTVLNPNSRFAGTLFTSRSLQLLQVSVNAACRIQLYGTVAAQSSDAYRAVDVPPPAGTIQNVISDLVLDTAPYQWSYQNRIAGNSDTPQQASIYVTVTNLGSVSTAITVTLLYAPLET